MKRGNPKRQEVSGPKRDLLLAELEADRRYREALRFIKYKLDLFGEEKLTAEEMAFVKKHHDFFYPERE